MARQKGHQENESAAAPTELPSEIAFDYIKSNSFRVICVDGAFGGLAPSGRSLHMAVFSERRALPRRIVHSVSPDGTVGDELREKREGRAAIIRELEADLSMDLPTAVAVHKWLGDKIKEMARAHGVDLGAFELGMKK
jgi:hypothetical protein